MLPVYKLKNQKNNEPVLKIEKNKYKGIKLYFLFCFFRSLKNLLSSLIFASFMIDIFFEVERKQLVKK